MMKEEAGRKIEAHIAMLVDYDVLNAQVADTLTEYIWSFINGIDNVVDTDQLEELWKKNKNGYL
jgi:hypothetical protein